MPAPVRRPLLRRLSAAVLLCLLIALPLAAHLLHWDDQLRLYWQERSTGAEQAPPASGCRTIAWRWSASCPAWPATKPPG